MFEYEKNITAYAVKRGYDGVICGHIHNASIHTVNEVEYMNDGDWVESLTALIEHLDGTWTIHYHAGNSIGQHG
jgi:UDP-2,3-diacylglucosamine pyrophosphatase LpxH